MRGIFNFLSIAIAFLALHPSLASRDSILSRMAPPASAGKRAKGVQIFRPFIYGTTARPFDEKTNPKPPGVPDDHTHSWTVFVKGVDDTDITYWLRRVQFKLHESIPNHVRSKSTSVLLRWLLVQPTVPAFFMAHGH